MKALPASFHFVDWESVIVLKSLTFVVYSSNIITPKDVQTYLLYEFCVWLVCVLFYFHAFSNFGSCSLAPVKAAENCTFGPPT